MRNEILHNDFDREVTGWELYQDLGKLWILRPTFTHFGVDAWFDGVSTLKEKRGRVNPGLLIYTLRVTGNVMELLYEPQFRYYSQQSHRLDDHRLRPQTPY